MTTKIRATNIWKKLNNLEVLKGIDLEVNEGEVVDGEVIAMNKREVVINIGYKSDGVVSTSEFRYNQDLKIGDKIQLQTPKYIANCILNEIRKQ